MTVRCSWEVTAGLFSDDDEAENGGPPTPEHTKQWFLTAEDWEKSNRIQMLVEKNALVETYTLSLRMQAAQEDSDIDWVRVQFTWIRE